MKTSSLFSLNIVNETREQKNRMGKERTERRRNNRKGGRTELASSKTRQHGTRTRWADSCDLQSLSRSFRSWLMISFTAVYVSHHSVNWLRFDICIQPTSRARRRLLGKLIIKQLAFWSCVCSSSYLLKSKMDCVHRPERLDRQRIIKIISRVTFVVDVLWLFCNACVILIGTRERSPRKWQKLVYWLLSWSNSTDKRQDHEAEKDNQRAMDYVVHLHGSREGSASSYSSWTSQDWLIRCVWWSSRRKRAPLAVPDRFFSFFSSSPSLSFHDYGYFFLFHYSGKPLVTNQLLTSFVVWFICVWIDDNSLRIVSSFILSYSAGASLERRREYEEKEKEQVIESCWALFGRVGRD